jgi:hypothetical protein
MTCGPAGDSDVKTDELMDRGMEGWRDGGMEGSRGMMHEEQAGWSDICRVVDSEEARMGGWWQIAMTLSMVRSSSIHGWGRESGRSGGERRIRSGRQGELHGRGSMCNEERRRGMGGMGGMWMANTHADCGQSVFPMLTGFREI